MSEQRNTDKEFVNIVENNLLDVDDACDDVILEEYYVRMQKRKIYPPRIIPMGYMIIQPIEADEFFDGFDEEIEGYGYEDN